MINYPFCKLNAVTATHDQNVYSGCFKKALYTLLLTQAVFFGKGIEVIGIVVAACNGIGIGAGIGTGQRVAAITAGTVFTAAGQEENNHEQQGQQALLDKFHNRAFWFKQETAKFIPAAIFICRLQVRVQQLCGKLPTRAEYPHHLPEY
jgi:hypothetical protein